jgi:hypothetical protein
LWGSQSWLQPPFQAACYYAKLSIEAGVPTIRFTRNIQRHVQCPVREVSGATVREALDDYFRAHDQARGYVLDDQGKLRRHMAIFIDGNQLQDRENLSDPVTRNAVLDVVQALSGG